MKQIKLIAFLFITALVTSCSSDNNGGSSATTEDYFNFTYDSQAKTVNNWEAIKQEDFIEVSGTTADGAGIDFKFNSYGDLYSAFTHPATASSTTPVLTSFEYNSSSSFTFEMVELNTTQKTVKVNFSGKIYEDQYDDQSAYKTISGSFKVTYTELVPQISGLGTYAKVNGQDWHGLSFDSSGNGETTELNVKSDNEYNISIVYPYFSPVSGTFTFANNTADKRISFSKYDPVTHDIIDYKVSGTITYNVANTTYVQGTFNLTATHPTNGSTVTITNGTFKELTAN